MTGFSTVYFNAMCCNETIYAKYVHSLLSDVLWQLFAAAHDTNLSAQRDSKVEMINQQVIVTRTIHVAVSLLSDFCLTAEVLLQNQSR